MSTLEELLSPDVTKRMGWVLLHFVWEATLLAALLGIGLQVLRRKSAKLRYAAAYSALVLLALLPVMTWLMIPNPPVEPSDVSYPPLPKLTVSETASIPVSDAIVAREQDEGQAMMSLSAWKTRITLLAEPRLPTIVWTWLIGVMTVSICQLGGWFFVRSRIHRQIKPIDASLSQVLEELVRKLAIRRPVRLLESALATVPCTLGWLRPIIFWPAAAMSGLTPTQIEAVLAHELAHIRRYDYLANILQVVVETLGFYHPAVWWVSRKIRLEREHCCDDLALKHCDNSADYAKALLYIAEVHNPQIEPVLAASGGSFFQRIKRILQDESARPTYRSWLHVSIALIVLLGAAIPTTFALCSHGDTPDLQDQPSILMATIDPNQFKLDEPNLADPNDREIKTEWVFKNGKWLPLNSLSEVPQLSNTIKPSMIEMVPKYNSIFTKVFTLQYAECNKIADLLKQLSKRVPESEIATNEKTNSVIVQTHASLLQQMEDVIAYLDTPGRDKPSISSEPITAQEQQQIQEHLNLLRDERETIFKNMELSRERIRQISLSDLHTGRTKETQQTHMASLLAELNTVESRRIQLETELTMLLKGPQAQMTSAAETVRLRQEYINNDPTVIALTAKVIQVEMDLILARQNHMEEHPEVKNKDRLHTELELRLTKLKREVGIEFETKLAQEAARMHDQRVAQIKFQIEQAQTQEKRLHERIAELEEISRKQSISTYELNDLQFQLNLDKEMYDAVSRRIRQIELERKKRPSTSSR